MGGRVFVLRRLAAVESDNSKPMARDWMVPVAGTTTTRRVCRLFDRRNASYWTKETEKVKVYSNLYL